MTEKNAKPQSDTTREPEMTAEEVEAYRRKLRDLSGKTRDQLMKAFDHTFHS